MVHTYTRALAVNGIDMTPEEVIDHIHTAKTSLFPSSFKAYGERTLKIAKEAVRTHGCDVAVNNRRMRAMWLSCFGGVYVGVFVHVYCSVRFRTTFRRVSSLLPKQTS